MMACIADKVLAAPFALIGSIGVVAQLPNFHKLLKKHDVDYEVLTAGEYKRTLTLFGENTEHGRRKFIEELEDTHTLLAPYMWGRWRSGAPKWCRPGHGWFNERMLGAMQRQGYKCVLGGVYGLDPQLHAPRLISRHLAWGAYGGAIIVLHDGGGHRVTQTVQVLDWIIPQLLDRGYEFMTLSELWNNSCYSATESGSAEESSSPAGRPLTSA